MIENRNSEMSCSGFTLIELLIGIIVGLIFFTAVGAFYVDQTKSHEDHQMIVEMGQNGRAALALITNDLMLAGYAPKRITTGETATVKEALINKLHVTYDANSNGRLDVSPPYSEETVYEFVYNADGILGPALKRNGIRIFSPGEVQYVRFLYAYDDKGDGKLTKGGGTIWGHCAPGKSIMKHGYTINERTGGIVDRSPDDVSVDRIRAVKVWIVLRSRKRMNKPSVDPPMGIIPSRYGSVVNLDLRSTNSLNFDSGYAYRLFTTTVKLRNMYFRDKTR